MTIGDLVYSTYDVKDPLSFEVLKYTMGIVTGIKYNKKHDTTYVTIKWNIFDEPENHWSDHYPESTAHFFEDYYKLFYKRNISQ